MDLKGLPTIMVSFLSFKLNIQGCSPLTVSEYCSDIRCFFRHIISKRTNTPEKDVDISVLDASCADSVTTDEILGYLIDLAQRKRSKPTISRKLSAIKAFYKYHTANSHQLTNNPAKDVDPPKKSKTLPKVMTLKEAQMLISSFDKNEPNYKRNLFIVLAFLNCGMRLSELASIDLADIDSDYRRFVVRGKGDKIRTLYFNDVCRQALIDYLLVRETVARSRGRSIKDKNALLLSTEGNRMSVKTIQWMINRQFKLCGLDKRGYSVHKLRHTAATLMYNEGGVDILMLKEILGHSQLSTTQIYTHVRPSGIQIALSNNPLNVNFVPTHQRRKKRSKKVPKQKKPLFVITNTLREKYGIKN